MKNAADFFLYCRLREHARLAKAHGGPPPWSKDPHLQQWSFCNVFREDDKVTRWFRENVRGPLQHDYRVLFATIAFRWFNWPATGELILPYLLGRWDRRKVFSALTLAKDRGEQVFTGAYRINSPGGIDKLTAILDCLDYAHENRVAFVSTIDGGTLENAHAVLQDIPRIGRFMAYEIVTDLRHTYLLRGATDIHTWASAGPGCARGLGWVTHGDPLIYNYGSNADQRVMLELMRDLLAYSEHDEYWPDAWPRWEMREVEHCLCELDKYKRARLGQRLKRKFKGTAA